MSKPESSKAIPEAIAPESPTAVPGANLPEPVSLPNLFESLKAELTLAQKATHKQGEQMGRILSDMAMSVKKIEANTSFGELLQDIKSKLAVFEKSTESASPAQSSSVEGVVELRSQVQQLTAITEEIRGVVAAQADVVLALKSNQSDLIDALSTTLSTLLDEIREIKTTALETPPSKKKGFFRK